MASEELIPKKFKKNEETSTSRKCGLWLCQIISEAFLEEEDLLHYIGRIESSLTRSAVGAVLLILSYTFSVLSLTVGILCFGVCLCQPVLPIFLIVHGTAMSFRSLLETCKLCGYKKKEPVEEGCSPMSTFSKISSIFIVFWTITGSVWVYSISNQVNLEQRNSANFCDPLLYWYSLVLVSIILSGIVLKGVFLLTICVVYCKYENDNLYSHIMTENLGEFV